jgi:hypothetical protein
LRPTWASRGDFHRFPCLALVLAGQPFHSVTRNLSIATSSFRAGLDIVSVLEPTISNCVSRRRDSPHGQRSFLRSTPRPTRLLVPIVIFSAINDKSLGLKFEEKTRDTLCLLCSTSENRTFVIPLFHFHSWLWNIPQADHGSELETYAPICTMKGFFLRPFCNP